ncbi:MAG: hypothetical protein CYG59_15970 [Chloroflexi bacterium]|nr:MAG: hypothetical protein CYG59_15970 [Chloroflexota bacterium]
MSEPDVFLNEQHLRSADSLAFRSVGLEALDLDRVTRHIQDAFKRGRYPEQWPTEALGYLLRRGCAIEVDGTYYPTVAGVLCFGQEPQSLIPDAVVDIAHYRGTVVGREQLIHFEKDVSGTIFDQLQRIESYLWQNTHHGMNTDSDSFQRRELHEYPRVVIRELAVNALSHRDYHLTDTSIRITLFRDRIQWDSPGGLPPGVTVENILLQQKSRNRSISRVLYEAGYVEAFGQGLDIVVNVLRDEGMDEPRFEDIGAAFIVTVFGRKLETLQVGLYAHLPESQQRIMNYLREHDEVAPAELIERFAPERSRRSVQRDLDQLVEASLVAATGQGKARRYFVLGRKG